MIEDLRSLIERYHNDEFWLITPSERMLSVALLCQIHDINLRLEKLRDELDHNIVSEAVGINFSKILAEDYWPDTILFNEDHEESKRDYFSFVNLIPDYFTANDKEKRFKDTLVEPLKSAFHQFLDEEKLSFGVMAHALNEAISKMKTLLTEIKRKIDNPHSYVYRKVWDELYSDYKDGGIDDMFRRWLNDKAKVDVTILKKKQLCEILGMMKRKFFRYCERPSIGEVKNCMLLRNEDSLPAGTELTDEIKEECAKFEKFISFKKDLIFNLDYEMLGKYIAMNGAKLEDVEYVGLVDFDVMMDCINAEMANIRPSLKVYLKNHEENKVGEILNYGTPILNSCQKYLRDGLRNTILREFLVKALHDGEIKNYLMERLGNGRLRNKCLCLIIAALDLHRVFRVDAVSQDLAKSLSEACEGKPSAASIKDYIDDYRSNHANDKIYLWTKRNIEDLKSHPYNIFCGI